MTFAALQSLADRASLFTALRQNALAEATDALGENKWDIDMAARTLTFTAADAPSRQLVARVDLIATIAPGPRSLLWGWAHPRGEADGPAAALRAYGEQHGIVELTTPEIPFPDETGEDVEAWVAQTAHTIGGVAVEIIGRSPYYSAPTGGGSRAVFLLDLPLPVLTVAQATTALPRIRDGLTIADERSAAWDLARLAGWGMQWADDAYSGAIVSDATGASTIRFDEHARISGIEAAATH
ncbi:hypothetical protein GCM10025768_21130 [Microbacterium pseudoresistens]|uniref:Uncharacterized protein n=1 Tax=Microbacterium pseudoresistens TaxID=640634 RepID=A0A7Y9JLJ9_9MICO|nr:DUF6882 domain-containing protein [Microbacterium pseudoresistens]NYD53410.1 hypothetical protein [Microbacterium pseudoresistens]